MDWKLTLSLSFPAAIAVVGWVVSHYLSVKRDQANRRKEELTRYLINAYRKLEKGSNPRVPEDTWDDIEEAIADIQLLGSKAEADLAAEFADAMGENDYASSYALLSELRKSLREELGLEPLEKGIKFLRFNAVSPEEHIRNRAGDNSDKSLKYGDAP